MSSLGGVKFNVINENRVYSNEITKHPVEDGADITDHAKNEQIAFNIEGRVGDDENPAHVHQQLTMIRNHKKIVDYKGRAILPNCIVQNFESDADAGSIEGFSFSLTIVQITVSKPSTVSLLPVSLKVDVADVGNAGRVKPT